MADSNTIQSMLDQMPTIENAVAATAATGEGSRQELALEFQQGQLKVRPGSDTIEYMLTTESSIVTPSSSRRFGNTRLSAGANVRVNRTVIDGTPCWIMSNTHIEACITHIPEQQRGLRGYWPMDAGSGQVINDSSGNANDGLRGGSPANEPEDPSWTADCRYGSCLDFDGTDDVVTVEGAASLNITDSITVTAWIHQDSHLNGSEWTAVRRSENAYLLEPGDRGEDYWAFGIDNGTGFERVDTTQPLAINEWHQLTGVYNGTTLKIYVDGRLDNQTRIQGDIQPQAGNLWIGGWQGTEWFDGRIDEVGVYSYAMSPVEVEARYRTGLYGRSFFRTEELLVHYQNQDTGLAPERATVETFVNSNRTASYGFGSTSVEETGAGLPEGRLDVFVKTLLGIDYQVNINLLSGADFIELRMEEG